ncbi:FGGY-family carbohydrate kinase [Sinorhizobium mexicanum]|uniref:ATP:glycerol 3-phosphotransferase n=1 Tax=Sinorhizobium mexicanum TaxID=375549 RepID=A0A859QZH3_9HYPH|nr:FGGY family carbohydrate kinase [Sinorhizobium mexicanum]MBP1884111.1 glycerol kinase [Sinorhizobium mexicanum]QLL64829.1 glycerol kinase [Sinorhizobium mexicanum]
MTSGRVIAIDQGTTNTKAILVDGAGGIVAKASSPLKSTYPRPGWAEQSAEDIWASVRAVITDIVATGISDIRGLAIANQRETLVVWDAGTGSPIAPAILWQCRRTAQACEALIESGAGPAVVDATGLSINALFPASKLAWVMENVPAAKSLAAQGRLRAGTVDSWLLYRLTGGREFATDHSNASRTQLFNTDRLAWDESLCALFGAPLSALPEPKPSDSLFGHTVEGATALPAGVPILTMMGDSHAALYGHGVRAPGLVKATYGTGSSLMTLTPRRVMSRHGLSSTIAWSDRDGTVYALEGNITVSAQAAAFAATLLGLADTRALSDLAQTVPDSGGVTFVPALAGLGAPHWNDNATGTISGMTLASTPAHVARATFEAIALQIADVFSAMEKDVGTPLRGLLADGGASANDFLMRLQADILDRPVSRGDQAEVGAIGVATLARRSLGMGSNGETEEIHRFAPGGMSAPERDGLLRNWARAVTQAIHDR